MGFSSPSSTNLNNIMVKSELWKLQLDNIKVYLNNNGLNVDKVIRWQGGFAHGGTKHGLTIITT
jgi:hypothetical protein